MRASTVLLGVGAGCLAFAITMCGSDGGVTPSADGGAPLDATTDGGGALDGASALDAGGDAGLATDSGLATDAGDAGPAAPWGVFTHRNDVARTGQNLNETLLTPANVGSSKFGKVFSLPVDGFLYAQPLFAPDVALADGGVRDLLIVASEHDTVYAFDAANGGAPVWKVSLLPPGASSVPAADTGDPFDLKPEIGITGTPVIDPIGHTIYVVAKTKEAGPTYVQRLHALDLATGAEKLGGPVVITASAATADGGVTTFDALHHLQRPALLLANGRVYSAYGSHGDLNVWHGWVIAHDAKTLAPAGSYCATPDGIGSSVWQSGDGLAADALGNVYLETGNGPFDGTRNFGDSALKLAANGTLLDWFAPFDQAFQAAVDLDFGSAGPLLLPDQAGAHPHLMIASGKPGKFYVLDRDNLGHKGTVSDGQIVQTVNVAVNVSDAGQEQGMFSAPAYFNGNLYVTPVDSSLMQFSIASGAVSAAPIHKSARTYQFPGPHVSISANGATNGIAWTMDCDGSYPALPAVLRAYDAANVSTELYGSDVAAAGRDNAGVAVKFTVPTIARGRVYVGTQTEVTVFGLLP